MKSFWDKAIEKHRKGKGIKHKTARGPKTKASAIYGGMGEREIQIKLELLLDPIISSQKGVLVPAKNLCVFNMQDQERFIKTVDKISETNVELAYNFCYHGVESLKCLDESQWDDWINEIIKKNDNSGIDESIKLMDNITLYSDELAGSSASINFIDFSKTIESLLTGLNGRPLKVEVAEEIYTDTETIFLPERISSEDTKEKNFLLIKASAIHLWAQTYYGTWRINKDDFDAFEDKEKAIKAYHFLETIRLDEKIKKELPGAGRILEELNPKNNLELISKNFKKAINILSKESSDHKDSLGLISSILNDLDKIPSSPYAGNLKIDSVGGIADERINQDKVNFEKALDEMHEQWKKVENDSQPPNDDKDQGSEKTFSIEKNNSNDEYDIALEYGDSSITPPENIKQIMDSIIQDFGEIPEEYLEPAGDGGYNKDEEKNDVVNDYDNSDYTHLYNEWDHATQKYRKNWCKLNVKTIEGVNNNFINETLSKHRGLLKNLNRTFEALRQDEKRLRKQNNGDDIDIDAFIDAYIDLKQGNEVDEKLFTKLNKVDRNVAVMFMIDMSGSTSGWVNKMEKESLVLLCESLEILGDTYSIYGFSGKTRNNCEVFKIKDFDEKYDKSVKDRISNIEAMDYTRMGASIRHSTMLLSQVEAKTKLLITLSDGKPDDVDGYRGTYGIEDTKKALIEARFLGIHTYCITIDDEAMDYLPYMYGKTNFAVINQVDKLPMKVSDIYRKITA
jgi:nitric oxide reductase NorD protein